MWTTITAAWKKIDATARWMALAFIGGVVVENNPWLVTSWLPDPYETQVFTGIHYVITGAIGAAMLRVRGIIPQNDVDKPTGT